MTDRAIVHNDIGRLMLVHDEEGLEYRGDDSAVAVAMSILDPEDITPNMGVPIVYAAKTIAKAMHGEADITAEPGGGEIHVMGATLWDEDEHPRDDDGKFVLKNEGAKAKFENVGKGKQSELFIGRGDLPGQENLPGFTDTGDYEAPKPEKKPIGDLMKHKGLKWIADKSKPMTTVPENLSDDPLPIEGSHYFRGKLPKRMIDEIKAELEGLGVEPRDTGSEVIWSYNDGQNSLTFSTGAKRSTSTSVTFTQTPMDYDPDTGKPAEPEPEPDDEDSQSISNVRGGRGRFKGATTIADLRAKLRKGESIHIAEYGGGTQVEVRRKAGSGATSRGIVATAELADEPEPDDQVGTDEHGQRRARAGGEYGANGEWYKGGAFIATQDLPKKLREKRDRAAAQQQYVMQGQRQDPKPGEFSIYNHAGEMFNRNKKPGDPIEINHQAVNYFGHDAATIEDLADRFHKGDRWVKVTDYPELARFEDLARMAKAGLEIPGAALDRAEAYGLLKPKPAPKAKKDPDDTGQYRLFSLAANIARMDAKGGTWITIGGTPNPKTGAKHSGGTPVKINSKGEIIIGPAALQGRDLNTGKEVKRTDRARRNVEAKRSRQANLYRMRKQSQAEGLDGKAVHSTYEELRDQNKAEVDGLKAMLKEARENLGVSTRNRSFTAGGDVDELQKRGYKFDDVADEMAGQWPEYLGSDDPAGTLYDLLAAGTPEYDSDEDLWYQAEKYIRQAKEADQGDDDFVPFGF